MFAIRIVILSIKNGNKASDKLSLNILKAFVAAECFLIWSKRDFEIASELYTPVFITIISTA